MNLHCTAYAFLRKLMIFQILDHHKKMQLIKLHFNKVCKDKMKRETKFSDFFLFI